MIIRVDAPSWRLRVIGLAVTAVLSACGAEQSDGSGAGAPQNPSGELSVYVVNYPLGFFAERIGGDRVDVVFPAPSGVDPAYWRPEREVVLRYQGADLILLNGAGYAGWTEMASLPIGRTVDTSRSFRERIIETEDTVVHAHGPGGEHVHAGTESHTWLDPTLAIEHARATLEALVGARPDHGPEFEANFVALESELRELDRQFAAAVAIDPKRPLLASHPVYQYLVRRYELDLRSVHWEPGMVPSPEAWQELTFLRSDHPADWMLWEGEPHPTVKARLEQMGVRSAVFELCATAPDEGDYLSVMRSNASALATVFAP